MLEALEEAATAAALRMLIVPSGDVLTPREVTGGDPLAYVALFGRTHEWSTTS